MLKINYKKALVACTLLTAFCATSAFAAEPAKDTKEIIGKCGRHAPYCDGQRDCPEFRGPHEKHQRNFNKQKFEQRREEHRKHINEKMSKLSPQERKEVERFIEKDRKHRREMREEMHKMTPEQREAIRTHKWHHHHKPMPPHNCK